MRSDLSYRLTVDIILQYFWIHENIGRGRERKLIYK